MRLPRIICCDLIPVNPDQIPQLFFPRSHLTHSENKKVPNRTYFLMGPVKMSWNNANRLEMNKAYQVRSPRIGMMKFIISAQSVLGGVCTSPSVLVDNSMLFRYRVIPDVPCRQLVRR